MRNGYFTLVRFKYAYHVFIKCIDIERQFCKYHYQSILVIQRFEFQYDIYMKSEYLFKLVHTWNV